MTLLTKKRKNGDIFPSLNSNLYELFDINRYFNEPLITGFKRIPATNIRDTESEYIVELAAPGLKKKDFQIDIDNNILEIKVEKEQEVKEEKENYTRREYDFSAFYRSFDLPDTVQSDKIKAEYIDGTLRVHLPKVEPAKRKPARKINID